MRRAFVTTSGDILGPLVLDNTIRAKRALQQFFKRESSAGKIRHAMPVNCAHPIALEKSVTDTISPLSPRRELPLTAQQDANPACLPIGPWANWRSLEFASDEMDRFSPAIATPRAFSPCTATNRRDGFSLIPIKKL